MALAVLTPADTRVLPQGSRSGQAELPEEAIQTRTDFGQAGYGGAAPPKGETHRYIFTVHALDVEKIAVDVRSSGAMKVGVLTSISTASAARRLPPCLANPRMAA